MVLPVLKVQLRGLPGVEKLYREGPKRLDAALARALRKSANLVVKKAKQNITSNRSVNTGVARASIGMKIDGLTAIIGSILAGKATAGGAVGYPWFIEYSRKPGRLPPPRVLRQWIRRKMGVAEKDIDHVEFLLRRKIAAKGTIARPFLEPALTSSKTEIDSIFKAEVAAEASRLEGGR